MGITKGNEENKYIMKTFSRYFQFTTLLDDLEIIPPGRMSPLSPQKAPVDPHIWVVQPLGLAQVLSREGRGRWRISLEEQETTLRRRLEQL